VLAVLAAPACASAADGLLETITVDPASTTLTKGTVTLKSGTRYSLEVTGTQSVKGPEGFGFQYDALYCFAGIGFDHPECSPPSRGDGELMVTVGSEHPDAVDRFQSFAPHDRTKDLPYDPNHSYSMAFFAPQTGVLTAGGSDAWTQCKAAPNPCQDSVSGSFTIKIFGPATSGGGGTTGGGTGGGGACESSVFARVAKACGTADLPFGTAALLPVPEPENYVDISSGKLPAKTKEVDVGIDMTDAEIDKLVSILALAKRTQYERRDKALKDMLGACMLYGLAGGTITTSLDYMSYKKDERIDIGSLGATGVACVIYMQRHPEALGSRALSAKAGCRPQLLTVWKPGVKPSRRTLKQAQAAFASSATPSCTARHGHLALKLKARKGQTLNGLLGKHAVATVTRKVKGTADDGPNARMSISWGRS
jgi:hypothetical protein